MTDALGRAWDAAARFVALTGEQVRVSQVAGGVQLSFRATPMDGALHLEVLRVLGDSERFGHDRLPDGNGELWATYHESRP
ncbi:hypothetical protein ACI1MP_17390 [Kitasatospora griseola]|uniref:hypothetical protein n=1 Tax=Kitasatospora griseola TaxID=2064 RepID=UPI0038559ED7